MWLSNLAPEISVHSKLENSIYKWPDEISNLVKHKASHFRDVSVLFKPFTLKRSNTIAGDFFYLEEGINY